MRMPAHTSNTQTRNIQTRNTHEQYTQQHMQHPKEWF